MTRLGRAGRRQRLAAAALVLAVLAVLTGCTGKPGSAPDAPAATSPSTAAWSPALAATLTRYSQDVTNGVVQVQVTNAGPHPVHIDRVRVLWPGWRTQRYTRDDVVLEPGRTVDLPVPIGRARCADSTRPPRSRGSAQLRVQLADESARRVRVRFSDARDLLAPVWLAECRSRALARAVDVRFGRHWERAGTEQDPALRGTVELTRLGSNRPVRVTGFLGSVLLDVDPLGSVRPPLLRMPASSRKASLPVEVTSSGRCDGHALAESKQTFLLEAYVRDGRTPAATVVLVPPEPVQHRMRAVIDRACGVD